jgi:type II secretion system protein G
MGSTGDRSASDGAGFTLVELLVVTAVLAIIMAIAVASLSGALDKARQGATIADMRNLGTAIEAYQVDHSLPPQVGAGFEDTVAPLLVPYHNRIVPVTDHWGNVYGYETDGLGAYSLISYGKDGVDGNDLTPMTKGEFDRDILLTNGEFPGLQ